MIYCLITNDHLQLSTLHEISGNYSTKWMPFNDIITISCFHNSNIHQINYPMLFSLHIKVIQLLRDTTCVMRIIFSFYVLYLYFCNPHYAINQGKETIFQINRWNITAINIF